MKNRISSLLIWLVCFSSVQPLFAQDAIQPTTILERRHQPQQAVPQQQRDPVFEFSYKKDLPILVGGVALSITGYLLKEKVDPLTEAQIAALDPGSINAFDRGATRNLRELDAHLSDYLLTFSAISPFTVLASRSIRRESLAVMVMYFETAAMVGGLTNITKGLVKRKRPYVYNPEAPMDEKFDIDARHSFFSGHVSHSAAFMYLTAYMVDRYADRPGWKWAAWSGAVVVPGTIAYWRYSSGKHFPSDVLLGYAVGAGTGLLIPWLHRYQLPKDVSLNVMPAPNGLYLSLTF